MNDAGDRSTPGKAAPDRGIEGYAVSWRGGGGGAADDAGAVSGAGAVEGCFEV
ncbi:hypothetical protein ACFWVF_19660 [Streptomyces sp. NPDC058659]|uniref:hypothetical protein n=1 Tax=unclassified Streptomyces TaxID=2593676 RepID=UPI00365E126D